MTEVSGVFNLGLAAIAGLIMLLFRLTELEELVTSGSELRIGEEVLLLLFCLSTIFGLSSTSLPTDD